MAINVGSASVTLMPSMSGFGSKVDSALSSAGASGSKTFSKAFNSGLSKSIGAESLKGLQGKVDSAAANLKSAMAGAKSATLAAEAAQLKYNEALSKYGAGSSQAVSAEGRLVQAKYRAETASDKAKAAEKELASAQKELAGAAKQPDSALQRLGGSVKELAGNMKVGEGATKGFSAKLAAISGATAGIAMSLGQAAINAIGNLTGEMAAASDSTDKFRSTLNFAGVDTGAIDALTKSTQDYADKTVYDLSDIRNVTAQLASNGVKDYDKLAEAARIAKAERDGFEAALDLGNSVRGAEIVLRTIQQRISELEGKGGER